ncbi:hypothetical protein RU01_06000 [Rhodococcus sp. MEB064]|nr:hypothetical protein RU01_06000 [Rhodococcus sp. MEB064]
MSPVCDVPGMSLASKAFAGFDVDGRHIRIVITDAARIVEATALARRELDSAFDVFSATRLQSELQKLNRSFGRTMRVSPAMAEHLRRALAAAESSGGAVDPLGAGSGSYQDIDFDGTSVRLPQWGTLDLDGTAPEAAARRVEASIARRFGCDVVITVSGARRDDGRSPRHSWISAS